MASISEFIGALADFRDNLDDTLSAYANVLLQDRVFRALEKRADLVMPTPLSGQEATTAPSSISEPILPDSVASQPQATDSLKLDIGTVSPPSIDSISSTINQQRVDLPSQFEAPDVFSVMESDFADVSKSISPSVSLSTFTDHDTSVSGVESSRKVKPQYALSPFLPIDVFRTHNNITDSGYDIENRSARYIWQFSQFNGLRVANTATVSRFLEQSFGQSISDVRLDAITANDFVYDESTGTLGASAPMQLAQNVSGEELRRAAVSSVVDFRSTLISSIRGNMRIAPNVLQQKLHETLLAMRAYKQYMIAKVSKDYADYADLMRHFDTVFKDENALPFSIVDEYTRARWMIDRATREIDDVTLKYPYLGERGAFSYKFNMGLLDSDDQFFPGHGAVFPVEIKDIDGVHRIPPVSIDRNEFWKDVDGYIHNVINEKMFRGYHKANAKSLYDSMHNLFEEWVTQFERGTFFIDGEMADVTAKLLSDVNYSVDQAVNDLKAQAGRLGAAQRIITTLKSAGVSEDTAYKIVLQHYYYKIITATALSNYANADRTVLDGTFFVPSSLTHASDTDSIALALNSSVLSYLNHALIRNYAARPSASDDSYRRFRVNTRQIEYSLANESIDNYIDALDRLLMTQLDMYEYQAKAAAIESMVTTRAKSLADAVKENLKGIVSSQDGPPPVIRFPDFDIDCSALEVRSKENQIDWDARSRAVRYILQDILAKQESLRSNDFGLKNPDAFFADKDIKVFFKADDYGYLINERERAISDYQSSVYASVLQAHKKDIDNFLTSIREVGVVHEDIGHHLFFKLTNAKEEVERITKEMEKASPKAKIGLFIDKLAADAKYRAYADIIEVIDTINSREIQNRPTINAILRELNLNPADYPFYVNSKSMFSSLAYSSKDLMASLYSNPSARDIPKPVFDKLLLDGIRTDVIDTLVDNPNVVNDIHKILNGKPPSTRTVWEMYINIMPPSELSNAQTQKALISQLPGGYFEAFRDWLRYAPITDIIALMLGVSLPAAGLFAMAFGKPLFGGLLMAGGAASLLLGRSPAHLYLLDRPLKLRKR